MNDIEEIISAVMQKKENAVKSKAAKVISV
jgi:hypothetical protein